MAGIKYIYYNTLLEFFTIMLNRYLILKDYAKVDYYLSKKKKIAPSMRALKSR